MTRQHSKADVLAGLSPLDGSLHTRVADALQKLIADHHLIPGDRLPSQVELAERLGVSPVTLRQGIRILEQRGLVETRRGSGSIVSAVAAGEVADSIERFSVFGNYQHQDLIELREAIEPRGAALAAERATDDDLARLRELVDHLELTFERRDAGAFADADMQFHLAVAHASRNPLIIAILCGLEKMLRILFDVQRRNIDSEPGTYAHRLVFDAIHARNPTEAASRMADVIAPARLLEDHPGAMQTVMERFTAAWPYGGGGRSRRGVPELTLSNSGPA